LQNLVDKRSEKHAIVNFYSHRFAIFNKSEQILDDFCRVYDLNVNFFEGIWTKGKKSIKEVVF
jgi:hypothetical protein